MVQKIKKAGNPVNPENIINAGDEFEKIKVIGKVDGSKKLLCKCLEWYEEEYLIKNNAPEE